ncbi:hypothetical protein ACFYOY_23890 [Streptomyces sp. NPDC007875]|uniref:hypothetical protein n=1 Tax=Streptomyces sp. NPDC007875 TaxID=3364783 RepID=UPI0036A5C08C
MDAVLSTKGANVPRPALEAIAPFVVAPKLAVLSSSQAGHGKLSLRPDRMRVLNTTYGQLLVATVQLHGAAGCLWPHNERLTGVWPSAADPAHAPDRTSVLPSIRPWTQQAEAGGEAEACALSSTLRNTGELVELLRRTDAAVADQDTARLRSLIEDMAASGQTEPCLYVPHAVEVEDAVDGADRGPGPYWAWMAADGNSRTRCRQELLGVTSEEVLTGVPFAKLRRPGTGLATNPGFWLTSLSSSLNAEYADAVQAKDADSPAFRAHKVAVVEAHLVIGTPTPRRLLSIVRDHIRREHLFQPLPHKAADLSLTLGRSVLDAYVAQGLLDEVTASVLAGLRPARDLPEAPHGASTAALRDLRSMRLLTELFPTDPDRRALLRRALDEPPPSRLSVRDVRHRTRLWSALSAQSYPRAWNPRVAEVLPASSGRTGITLSGRPLDELLAAADTDMSALEELLLFRAPHWLAFFGIVNLGPGSPLRRTMPARIAALRANPVMAAGLLRELAAAMNGGDRTPSRVDEEGEATREGASAAWFDRAFPPNSARHEPAPEPLDTPAQSLWRAKDQLAQEIEKIDRVTARLRGRLAEVESAAQVAEVHHPFDTTEADTLASRLSAIQHSLFEVRAAVSIFAQDEIDLEEKSATGFAEEHPGRRQ